MLAADALERIVEATQPAGATLVAVDALHDTLAHFHESLGFRRVPDGLRLVRNSPTSVPPYR